MIYKYSINAKAFVFFLLTEKVMFRKVSEGEQRYGNKLSDKRLKKRWSEERERWRPGRDILI